MLEPRSLSRSLHELIRAKFPRGLQLAASVIAPASKPMLIGMCATFLIKNSLFRKVSVAGRERTRGKSLSPMERGMLLLRFRRRPTRYEHWARCPAEIFFRITKVLALPKIINGAAARNSAIAQTALCHEEGAARRFLLFLSRVRRVSLGILFALDKIVSPWFLLKRPVAFASYNTDFNDMTSFAFAYLFVQMYSLQFISFKLLNIRLFNSHLTHFVANTMNFIRSRGAF